MAMDGDEKKAHPDRLAAVVSGFVAALALTVSTYNVYLQRQQLKAQVWPRVSVTFSNVSGFGFSVMNSGVGPADVRSVRIYVDQDRVEGWGEVVHRLSPAKPIHWVESSVDRVLSPGEHLMAFTFEEDDPALKLAFARRVHFDICYCSTLDECWTLKDYGRPSPTARCPSE